jgi:hypothetical protein
MGEETTIEQLIEALETSEGKTPQEVLDAFYPTQPQIGGHDLVPLTAGHELFLAKVDHPLASRQVAAWTPSDVAIAFFAFTRPSRELERMLRDGSFEDGFHEFLDDVPVGEIEGACSTLVLHWLSARKTAVEMVNPHGGPKKKRASGGSSRSSRGRATSSAGSPIR